MFIPLKYLNTSNVYLLSDSYQFDPDMPWCLTLSMIICNRMI